MGVEWRSCGGRVEVIWGSSGVIIEHTGVYRGYI